MHDLGTLGGPDAGVFYINERGEMAGISYVSSTPNPVTGLPPIDPFLWKNGEMVDLGTLGGADGGPGALNNSGQVVGLSSVGANPAACFTELDPNCHPFLWERGNLIDLATTTIGGSPITADGINDRGEIVGGADFSSAGGSSFDAYLWRKGAATDLGSVNGDCASRALAINSPGQVVGNSFTCDLDGPFHHSFLWENGSLIDLNSVIPADSPLELVVTYDINDRGEIAGQGVPRGVDPSNISTQGHAFLLIPCDEDHPGIEGCDYSMVAARAAVPQTSPAVLYATGSTLPAKLMRRFNGYHLPGRAFGSRN